jgi:hypothetical protein
MALPPEVVPHVPADATPEAAIAHLDQWTAQAWQHGRTLRSESEPLAARKAWSNALGAAAIRIAEIPHLEPVLHDRSEIHDSKTCLRCAWVRSSDAARAAYFALRNLPKQQEPKP